MYLIIVNTYFFVFSYFRYFRFKNIINILSTSTVVATSLVSFIYTSVVYHNITLLLMTNKQ